MPNFYWGTPKCPCAIVSKQDGYWLKDLDDADFRYIPYADPRDISFEIRKLYGFDLFGIFFGVIVYDPPREKSTAPSARRVGSRSVPV